MPQQPAQKVPLYVLAAALAAVLASAAMVGNPLSVPDQVLIDDAAFLRQPNGVLASFVPRLGPPLPPDAEVKPEYPAPLARLLWWLQFRLFNIHGAGYKATAIALHALAAALACLALARWTGSAGLGLAGSLLLALHPSTLPALLVRHQGALLGGILLWGMLLAVRAQPPRPGLAISLAVAAALTGPIGALAGVLAIALWSTAKESHAKRPALYAAIASLALTALLLAGAPYLRGHVPQVGSSGELAPAASGLGAALAGGGLQLLHTLLPIPLILERATAVNSPTYLALALSFLPAGAALIWLAARKREALLPVVWLLAGALAPALEAIGRRHAVTTSPASTYALVCGLALLLAVLAARPAAKAKKKRATRPTLRLRLLLPTAFVLLALIRVWYASAWGDELKMLQRALALSPNNPQYLCERGWALLDRGKAEAPLKDLTAAVEARPDYPRAHCGLGRLSLSREKLLGRYDELRAGESVRMLQLAAELDGNYAAPLVQLAYTFSEEGRPAPALELAQKALAVAPDWAEAEGALARVLLWRGQLPQAIAAARRALRLQPDLTPAQMTLVYASDPVAVSQAPYLNAADVVQPWEPGWSSWERILLRANAYLQRMRPEDAALNYDWLLGLKPAPEVQAMTYLNLAFAYEMQGDFARARRGLQTVGQLQCAQQWKETAASRAARINAYLRGRQP